MIPKSMWGVLPTLELDTCAKFTTPCPWRGTTPFFRHMSSGLRLYGEGFILQQDNEPKHTPEFFKSYLKTEEDRGVLTVMDVPQSPDLSPTLNIYRDTNEKATHSVTSQEALWNIVKSYCDNMGHQVLYKTFGVKLKCHQRRGHAKSYDIVKFMNNTNKIQLFTQIVILLLLPVIIAI